MTNLDLANIHFQCLNLYNHLHVYLNLTPSALQTKTYFCKQCRSWWDGSFSSGYILFVILFWFWLKPPFGTMVLTRSLDGRVHFRNSGMKGSTKHWYTLLAEADGLSCDYFQSITQSYISQVKQTSWEKSSVHFDMLLYLEKECVKRHALRKHAYSNILEISPPKTVSFLDKNSDIFHITALKHRL